jgi:hypothetical protein
MNNAQQLFTRKSAVMMAAMLRALKHPDVLEIVADCCDAIDTENSAAEDFDDMNQGSDWRNTANELRSEAAAIRVEEDPELWHDGPIPN